jgi:hypothetical protein
VNKLHIFGCSHSYDDIQPDERKVGTFWGKHLANSLDLKLYPTAGQTGKNVEYILLDIYDRMLNGVIAKDDVVVLNTSYPLRFGSPRLQQFDTPEKSPDGDEDHYPTDIPITEIKFDSEQVYGTRYIPVKKNKLNDKLTFDLWYKQTYSAWKLLSSVCNNVYQWTLVSTDDLDKMYENILQHLCTPHSEEVAVYEMYSYPSNNYWKEPIIKNNWEGLISSPSTHKDWDEWLVEVVRPNDGHMHSSRHKVFAELFLKQIKESELR